jgi:hypothetical protein
MMLPKRFHGSAVLLCLVTVVCLAPAADTKPAAARHTLWKVQGRANTVQLLGSLHFLRQEHYPLAKPIEDAFTRAQIVLLEVDPDEMNNPKTQTAMLVAGQCSPGTTLKDLVAADTYSLLTRHLKEHVAELPSGTLDTLKPWMAAVLLVALDLQPQGFKPEHGVDMHFFNRARAARKEVRALETVEFQLGLLSGLSPADSEEFLKETLRQSQTLRKLMAEVVAAWQTGEAARLDAILNDAMKDFPQLRKRFLTDRNHTWLPKIEELLRGNKDALVIVGAGHLVGREGLVELLRQKGFVVTQQ